MAETFRIGKVTKLLDRLEQRKHGYIAQLGRVNNDTLKATLSGHVVELEATIAEIKNEFGLKDYYPSWMTGHPL